MFARHLLSLGFWTFLVLSSVALFPIALAIFLVTAPFDRRRALLHRFTCFWASLYTWLNPAWPVTIEGRERIRRNAAYVIVANHQSLVDIFVLFRLRTHFKWVSKVENFRVPLIGWNMRLNRYIPLRRGSRGSALDMFRRCEAALAGGSSVMIFPEGTRSLDGKLRAFKPGAFELAKRARAPLLPIALDGSFAALPKRGYLLRGKHPIRVRILKEIAPEEIESLSVDALTAVVRDRIAQELGQTPTLSRTARA